jgi:lysophospholipase L1-like esterase
MKTILVAILLTAASFAQQQPSASAPDACAACQQQNERMHRQLQDWAELSRYHDDDVRVGPAHGQTRVAFLGDSITDGWHLDQYFPGKPYVNRGISGQTTPQMLVRMRPDVIDLEPQVMLVLAGTNDLSGNTGPETTQQIEENYASIAELARAHNIFVIFASVLPVSDYGPHPMTQGRPPEKILELNNWLKQYTAQHGLMYLDYFSHMVDEHGFLRKELSEDGLHPNAAGYKIMAPLAEQAIEQAQKRKGKK